MAAPHWIYSTLLMILSSCIIGLPPGDASSGITDPTLVTVLKTYDRTILPGVLNGNDTVVYIGMFFNHIALDLNRELLILDVSVRYEWLDVRMDQFYRVRDAQDRTTVLEPNAWSWIWTPDVVFQNAQMVREMTSPQALRYIEVRKGGRMLYTIRLEMSLRCPGLSSGMPISCAIVMESFGHRESELSLVWLIADSLVDLDTRLEIQGYVLDIITPSGDCLEGATRTRNDAPCLKMGLHFTPLFDPSLFLVGVYVCSFASVVLSWLGFWLNPHLPAVRLGFGIGLLLLLGLYEVGVGISKVAGLGGHGVDGWLAMCSCLILATLLEFALVHVLCRIIPRRTRAACCPRKIHGTDVEDLLIPNDERLDRVCRIIDVICGLFLFPAIFISYNVYYWSTTLRFT